MPIRWYACPVVTVTPVDPETGQELEARKIAKVGAITNPATGRGYRHSAAITAGGSWALAFVRVDAEADFSALAADSQCIDILEQSHEDAADILSTTPAQLGWSGAKLNRVRNRLQQRGISTAGIAATTTIEAILDRLAAGAAPGFRARGMRVR